MDKRFHELLRDWLSGNFTRADEQEMQALSDADEFRREAMEGYLSTAGEDHKRRLAALQERLRERNGYRPMVAVPRWPRFMAAAAALLLLLAAIWFVPRWLADEKSGLAAAPQTSDTFAAPAGDIAMNPDIAADQANDIRRPEPASGFSVRTPGSTGPLASAPQTDDVYVATQASEQEEAQQLSEAVLPPPPDGAAGAPAVAAADELKEENADKAPAAPARATESAKTRSKSLPADKKDASWHETDVKPDLESVRKKAKDDADAFSGPIDGWDEFSEYLRVNARLTPAARNNNISGTVKLQFNLDANAEPAQFRILRSLGYGCDEQAIQLVQDYEWRLGKNNVVTVEIHFVR